MYSRWLLLLCLLFAPALSHALAYQALALTSTAQMGIPAAEDHDCCADAEATDADCADHCDCAEPADCCPKSFAKLSAAAAALLPAALTLRSTSVDTPHPSDPAGRTDRPPVPPPNPSVQI